MSDPDLDQIAEDLLATEGTYEHGEWAAIKEDAKELVDEARSAGMAPKHYAAEKMTALVEAMTMREELSPDVEDLRFDLAVAAALVYVGRVGYE